MRLLLFIISYGLFVSLLGQGIYFNGQQVDTIFIKSHRSAYQFDNKGTTKGKAEKIYIIYDSTQNGYIINKYYRDKYSWTIRPEKMQLKKKIYKSEIGKRIDPRKIEKLLASLSTNVCAKNLFAQLDTSKLKGLITEKQIRRVAKWQDVAWQFRRRYSSKEENLEFFNSCKSIDTLNLYLEERFDTIGYSMVTDYSNTITIWISTTGHEYRFEGKYPNPVKQPWYDHSDTSLILPIPVLNLMVNQNLSDLLPKDFFLIKTISDEALVNDYITWYFERREMMY